MFKPTVAAMVVLASAPAVHAADVSALDLLQGFNGIVLGDMESTIHVEGTLFVGGDLNGSGGFYANSDQMADVTVGDVSGSLIVGGDINAPLTTAGKGGIVVGGSLNVANPNPNPNGQPITEGANVPVADVAAAMTSLSADLSAFADTAGASVDVTDPNIKRLTSGAGGTGVLDGIAVLNLTEAEATDFLGGGNLAHLNLDSGVTTILNMAGTSHSITGTFNQDDPSVLVNFFEATSLTIANTWGFSVLAPLADVSLITGGMDGTLVAGTLFQRVELRPYDNQGGDEVTFTGNLPEAELSAVPLPATGWLLIAAFAGLLVRRRAAL